MSDSIVMEVGHTLGVEKPFCEKESFNTSHRLDESLWQALFQQLLQLFLRFAA